MVYDIDIAKQVAKSLLQINAIILQPNNHFKWASGWNSPIYCDNRKILSYPEIRIYIKQGLAAIIKNHYKNANIIAGVATAGIPHGALVAEELGLPFIYVRSKAKKHGKKCQIEGVYEKGQSTILIEDLISSGMSSIDAAKILTQAGLKVKGITSIFTYGFAIATENFNKSNYKYISLCDFNILLEQAIKQKYIFNEDLDLIKNWKIDPANWKK